MGPVEIIAQDKLERVLPRGQAEGSFGLALAKVHDIVSGRQRHVQGRHPAAIDDQVVVAGIELVDAGGGHTHAFQAESHDEGFSDFSAIQG